MNEGLAKGWGGFPPPLRALLLVKAYDYEYNLQEFLLFPSIL